MKNLGMGSDMHDLSLDDDIIKEIVGDIEIGNYAFGMVSTDGNSFQPKYVGRSDDAEGGLLQEIINRRNDFIAEKRGYTHFKFIKVETVEESYLFESRNYHGCEGTKGGTDKFHNKEHPKHPGWEQYKDLYCEEPTCEYSEEEMNKEEEGKD